MKHISFLFLFILGSLKLDAQANLEAQLYKTTDRKAKMQLYYQIAQAYRSSNPKKVSENAWFAQKIATEINDKAMAGAAAFLNAEGYTLAGDNKEAKDRYITAYKFGKADNNMSLQTESLDKILDIVQKTGDGRDAARWAKEALDLLKRKGGNSGPSTPVISKTPTDDKQRVLLVQENEQLRREKADLERRLSTSSSGFQEKISGEKAKVAETQRILSQQKELADKELEGKNREISNMSEATAKQQLMLSERKRMNEKLENNAKKLDESLQRSNLELEKNQLLIERQGYLRNILLAISAGVLALAGLFFYRFREKKKANVVLEDQKKMVEEEQRRSDKLLLNILPKPIADELKSEGKAKARRYEQCSVLFTDFKNFTSIAEKMSPEELVNELDYCFKAFDSIVMHYQIEKIKTIGDAYMCATGLSDRTTSPNKLVRAALEIQEFMGEYKSEKMAKGEPFFEARIGIHTGAVVAGVVGSQKFAYDIWGDTVNTAARMEQNCEPGKINISEKTHSEVKYDFKCDYRGKLPAKNKGEIEMYYVTGKA
jgi:class 3 adenylate cyclase